MSTIEYLRIYADPAGCSHFETCSIELESKNYAPPAPPLNTSRLQSADNSVFLELPAGTPDPGYRGCDRAYLCYPFQLMVCYRHRGSRLHLTG